MLKFITRSWFGADGFCTQLSPWFFRWVCMSVTSGLECTVPVWTGLLHQVPNTLKLCQSFEANANRAQPSSLLPFSPLWMLLMCVRHLNCCARTLQDPLTSNNNEGWSAIQLCDPLAPSSSQIFTTKFLNHECIFIHVGIHDVVGQVSLRLLCWPCLSRQGYRV